MKFWLVPRWRGISTELGGIYEGADVERKGIIFIILCANLNFLEDNIAFLDLHIDISKYLL